MSRNNLGIIAYGTEEDRKKLAVLSNLSKQSGSEYIITMIRRQYKEVFGDADASSIPIYRT
jgi:hypothetical protein